jgi:hypothetical protein
LATECCQLQYHTVTKKGNQEGTIKSIIGAQHKETFLMEMKVKEIEKKLLELLLIHGHVCWWIGRPPTVG